MAYWFTSARMAATAASLISAGAGKSGKPWARLTAPCATASRVISRITDSVNVSALAEVCGTPEGYRRETRGAAGRCPGRLGMRMVPIELCRRAPKALLHDHLDGGLRPVTVIELAR